MGYRSAQSSRNFAGIVPYPQSENDRNHLELCVVCDAVVAGWSEGDKVCTTCGMTLVEPPFEGSDYLDMLIKQSRPGRTRGRRSP